MISINKIDVCPANLSEHRTVSNGQTPIGMTGPIICGSIGFRLDDDSR